MKKTIIALSVVAIISSSLVGCKSSGDSPFNQPIASTSYLSANTINAKKLALTTSSNFNALSTSSSNETSDRLVKIDAQGIASAVFNQEVSVNAYVAGNKDDDFIVISGDFKGKLQPAEETVESLNIRTFNVSSGTIDNANIDVNECTSIAIPKNTDTDNPVCLANGAAVIALATYEDAGKTYYAFFEMDNNGISSLKVWDGADEIVNVYSTHYSDQSGLVAARFAQLIVANNNIALYFTEGCCNKRIVIGNTSDGFEVLDISGALFSGTQAIIFKSGDSKLYDVTTNELSSITVDASCNICDAYWQKHENVSDIAVNASGAIYYISSQANNAELCKFSNNAITTVTAYTYNKLLAVGNIAYVLGKDTDNNNILHKIDLINDEYINNNVLEDLAFSSINSIGLTSGGLISISGTNTGGKLQTSTFNAETLEVTSFVTDIVITAPVAIN